MQLEVHIATCRGRKATKTWKHLESALLVAFMELHFELPTYNKKKDSVKYTEDIRFFRPETLRRGAPSLALLGRVFFSMNESVTPLLKSAFISGKSFCGCFF